MPPKTAPAARRPAAPRKKSDAIEIVVRRGSLRRFDALKTRTAELPVVVTWDRRTNERRDDQAAARGAQPRGRANAAGPAFYVGSGRFRGGRAVETTKIGTCGEGDCRCAGSGKSPQKVVNRCGVQAYRRPAETTVGLEDA